jgi:hypothetical protein
LEQLHITAENQERISIYTYHSERYALNLCALGEDEGSRLRKRSACFGTHDLNVVDNPF